MAIITLTSDIGKQDFLTGAIKGRILQINPELCIVDISHDVQPFNYHHAAYVCSNSIKNFPENTLHLIFINLFSNNNNHILLIRHNEQYIGIADNGLIKMILQESPKNVVALDTREYGTRNILNYTSVWINAYDQLLNGKPFEELGNPQIEIEEKNPLRPMHSSQYLEGQIIFIDNFENVIINITKEEFEQQRRGRSFKIYFTRGEVIDKISETYADVRESEKLAMFNSAGYLEIAINQGNAAGLFGLEGYVDPKSQYLQSRLLYQTVKIMFED